jgi:hypothetical protein
MQMWLHVNRSEVEGVIDVDIASYFDTIEQSQLLEVVSEEIVAPAFSALLSLARLRRAYDTREAEVERRGCRAVPAVPFLPTSLRIR